MQTEIINQNINVTAVRFGRGLTPVPKRIEFGGRSISFVDEGIRLSVKSGGRLTRLFNMSDGHRQFRLRQASDENSWRLVSISR